MNLERRDVTPPAELEDRTVSALVKEGLLTSRAASRRRLSLPLAAAAIFIAGVLAGRSSTPPVVLAPGAPPTRFLFLL